MEALKKIIGVIILGIVLLFSISMIMVLPKSIHRCMVRFQSGQTAEGIGSVLGVLIVVVAFVLLVIFLVRKSLKLIGVKNKAL